MVCRPVFLLVALMGLAAQVAVRAQTGSIPQEGLRQNLTNLASLDFPVRMHAARLIRRTPQAEAVPALIEAARRHPDEFVRYRALVLLTSFNQSGTRDLVRELLRDRNDRVREVAYKWLERHPDPQLAGSLLSALQTEESEFVRPALVAALAALGTDPAVQRALTVEVGRGLDFFRSAVIEALGRHRAVYAIDAIIATSRLDGPLQDDAALALARIGGVRSATALKEFTPRSAEAAQMIRGARCLIGEPCAEHLEALIATSSSEDERVSTIRAAIDAIAAVAQARSEAALAALLTLAERYSSIREYVAVVFSIVALREPEWTVEWIEIIGEATRQIAIALLKDGFDSIENDFEEEQFFAAVRAEYWASPDGSDRRALAATLIQRLEF